jgi:TonB-linked SusC/RagA family outer membrane protein
MQHIAEINKSLLKNTWLYKINFNLLNKTKMRKQLTCIIMLLLFFATAFAQTKVVQGKVTDENGLPVPFATITVKGTKTGVAADGNGNFKITVVTNAVLSITSANMLAVEVDVSGKSEIAVTLKSTGQLAEVVVTGVGVATSKKKVAIDIGTLSSKDIPKSAVASVEQALQGKIAGAQVQFTMGTPGSPAQITLRGVNDLAGTGPMILVDGVEASGGLTGLDLSTVDRIEVVKGAAAGTLYGAQGANGVIQIFTKKGGHGKKTSIDIRSQLSVDQAIRQNDLLANYHHFVTDAQGYIIKSGVRLQPDSKGAWPDPVFMDAASPSNNDIKNDKPYLEKRYDHISQAYRTAITSNTSLNISGGGEKSDYAFGASYLNQQNVLFNGYKRINLTSNLGFELFKNFNFRTTTQYIITDENMLAGGTRFYLTNSWPMIDFLHRDSLGNLVVKPKANENGLNPLAEQEWHERSQKQNRLVQSFNVNYKFPRFVELDYKFGAEIWNTDFNSFFHNQTSGLQSAQAFFGNNVAGSINNQFNKFQFFNSLATAYVRTDFENDFHLKIPIRTTSQFSYDWRNTKNRQYFAQGDILPAYPPFNINGAQNKTSGDFYDEFTTFGFLFNQTIEYGNLFGISGGIRSDYSSEFGEAKAPFTFPRGTVYFRPYELIKTKFLTDWKVRAAYGEAGIQPSRYARQITLAANTVGIGGVGLSTATQASNANLKVQRSKELEIGTDAAFKTGMKNWLSSFTISATYWNRKSEDVIQGADLPPSTGYQTVLDNLSSLSGRGVDISLDLKVAQIKDFDWNFGIRYGQFKIKVDKIANGKDIVTGAFGVQQGQELGIFYAATPLHSLSQMRKDKTPYINAANIGNYELVNGIVVDKTTHKALMTDPNDQSVLGSAFPKFNASFINTFTYKKNLTLSFQWDWRYGNKIYNLTRQWLYRDRLSKDYDKQITVDGQTGAFINFYNSLYNNVSPSGWFIENGSFLRLRDLSLSYNLTEKLKPKWARQVGITLSCRNLFTITKYGGLDPEATNTRDAQGNPALGIGAVNGIDAFNVPNLKSFQVGINLGF